MTLSHKETLKTMKERIFMAFNRLMQCGGRDLSLIHDSINLKIFAKYLRAVLILVEHSQKELEHYEKETKYTPTKEETIPNNPLQRIVDEFNQANGGF